MCASGCADVHFEVHCVTTLAEESVWVFMKGALLDREQGETALIVCYPTLFTVYWSVWVCGWKGVAMIHYLFFFF